MKLENYILGRWIAGDGEGVPLKNAFNGDIITYATTKGLNYSDILDYARKKGNPALRKMTFHERGRMLKALAIHLQQHLEKFYLLSYKTGRHKK
jgi:oxepin-CoA hydrolase/3-oxo-5,6-dehydrosuberyl-CoA semialdehyde dehydrogenase